MIKEINEHANWYCDTCDSTWVRFEHIDEKDCDEECQSPCLMRCCNEEECAGMAVKAIGAKVLLKWVDTPEPFETYISFGEYDENEDQDTYGVEDSDIFFYAEGLAELESLKTDSSNDWVLEEVLTIIYKRGVN